MIVWEGNSKNEPPWDADKYAGRYVLLLFGIAGAVILLILGYVHCWGCG